MHGIESCYSFILADKAEFEAGGEKGMSGISVSLPSALKYLQSSCLALFRAIEAEIWVCLTVYYWCLFLQENLSFTITPTLTFTY